MGETAGGILAGGKCPGRFWQGDFNRQSLESDILGNFVVVHFELDKISTVLERPIDEVTSTL